MTLFRLHNFFMIIKRNNITITKLHLKLESTLKRVTMKVIHWLLGFKVICSMF